QSAIKVQRECNERRFVFAILKSFGISFPKLVKFDDFWDFIPKTFDLRSCLSYTRVSKGGESYDRTQRIPRPIDQF
ncbi:MAG: hypothetical protein Q4F74_07780, partial [Synergistaceae bacterium]|nr:hypothetical protein [Synergistaceae bacterium]